MAIDFSCPYCGCRTQVADHFAGMTGNCRQCGQVVTIPAAPVDPLSPVPAAPVSARSAKKSTPVWLLVTIGVVAAVLLGGILVGVTYYAYSGRAKKTRGVEIPERMYSENVSRCGEHMRAVAVALAKYHDEFGSLPPAITTDSSGRAMHSWRVLILPYLGEDGASLYERYDLSQPWDSAKNKQLVGRMPEEFRCPDQPKNEKGKTRYLAIVGKGCAWEKDRCIKLEDVKDEPSWTLLVVESMKAVPWTQPVDLDYRRLKEGVGDGREAVGSLHLEAGATVALMDWRVDFVRAGEFSHLVIREAAQIADGDSQMKAEQRAYAAQRMREWEELERDDPDSFMDDPDDGVR